jgi:SAM-dependent methyltransferase
MDECSKSKLIWGDLERSVVSGSGIDIGCGPDPVTPSCRRFDIEHGDANYITKHVSETFDFVFSSHCLEHMYDPQVTILEWWKLVKTGGYLFFLVPDEDLYEQGVFPSRFNPDHKATFTISKSKSRSPRSFNVLDLAGSLPGGSITSIKLQDHGYNRQLMTFGPVNDTFALPPMVAKYRRIICKFPLLWRLCQFPQVIDQTMGNALAQIQCIVKKIQG